MLLGLVRDGQHRSAADAAALAIESNPDDAGFLGIAALAYLGMGDHDYATVLVNDAVRAAPTHPWPHAVRAQILMADGNWLEAELAASKAVALGPHQPDSQVLLGRAQIRTGQLEVAQATLAAVGQHQPSTPGLREAWEELQQALAARASRFAEQAAARAVAARTKADWERVSNWNAVVREEKKSVTTTRGLRPPNYRTMSIMLAMTGFGIWTFFLSRKIDDLYECGESREAWKLSDRVRRRLIMSVLSWVIGGGALYQRATGKVPLGL